MKLPKISCGTPRKQNAEINLMKLIACITIVCHHSVYATETENSRIWNGGWMSVSFFFCISGYLMAAYVFREASYSGNDLGSDTVRFMKRRIKGILPYYAFAWIFSFAILCLHYGYSFVEQVKTLIRSLFPSLLVYMAGFDGYEVVGAIWYLSAMYLCMPILYPLLRSKRNLFVWVIAPLTALFGYGWMHKVYGHTNLAMNWTGLCYCGILCAAVGLSCGCFCYGVSKWLEKQPLNKFSRVLVSLLDLGTFIACLIITFEKKARKTDTGVVK